MFLPPHTQVAPESLGHDSKEDVLDDLLECCQETARWFGRLQGAKRIRKGLVKRPSWLRVVK